jgi:hypothetical protein
MAGRREAEQEEALISGGGVGWRMQWREVRQAAGGRAGDTRSIGRDGGGGGMRAGDAGLNRRAGGRRGVGRAGGTRRVGRAVRGRSVGWARRAGVHLARLVG